MTPPPHPHPPPLTTLLEEKGIEIRFIFKAIRGGGVGGGGGGGEGCGAICSGGAIQGLRRVGCYTRWNYTR